MNKIQFQALLDKHDWYYSSSDDIRIWERGAEQERVIKLHMVERPDLYELYKTVRNIKFPHIKNK